MSRCWRMRVMMRVLAMVSFGLMAGAAAWSGGCAAPPAPIEAGGLLVGAEVYPEGVVAADHPDASLAGAEILAAGGNAVDAAVASSFALSVVRPESCGIGGGGFMLLHVGGRAVALNYRETAIGAMGPTYFEDRPGASGVSGGHAVAVPGTVRGLLLALEKYGTMSRAEVMAPAIRLAEEGFVADRTFVGARRSLEGGGPFVVENGRARNPAQGAALRLIAERGESAFYEGPIAGAIIGAVRGAGGEMTPGDLMGYRVSEVEPIRVEVFGREVVVFPPPSSGGVAILQVMRTLERLAPLEAGVYEHALVEAMKHAFADRAWSMADPAFAPVPVGELLSDETIGRYVSAFDAASTRPASAYGQMGGAVPVDSGTSHVSVVDRWGNAVACTETINTTYGSKVLVEEFGFFLNNEVDDFLTRRGAVNSYGLTQSERNLPQPGKRPLSSMSPTIVLNGGEVEMVAGGSGGPRIINGTLQVLLNAILFGDDARTAVEAPRLHHQWQPDRVGLERGVPGPVRSALEERGHETREGDSVGVVQFIRRAADGAGWEAWSDPRKGGRPAGP